MDWLAELNRLETSGGAPKELEENITHALEALLSEGDAKNLRLVLDWAGTRANFERFSKKFDGLWQKTMARQWKTEDHEKIWRLFAALDEDATDKPCAHALLDDETEQSSRQNPPDFIRDSGDLLHHDTGARIRVLLIQNEFTLRYQGGSMVRSQPEESTDYFRETARMVGHEFHFIDASRFSYFSGGRSGLEDSPDVETAISLAERINPDVIVIDGNYLPQEHGLTPTRVDQLRQVTGARLIAWIGDDHGSRSQAKARYWTSVCDLVVTFEPSAVHASEVRRRIQLIFFPVLVNVPDVPRDETRVFYSGTPRPDRLAYIAAIKDRGIQHTYNLRSRNVVGALEREIYLRNLVSHGYILNSGRRSGVRIGDREPVNIITGRAYEAVNVGALLLQRSGSRLDYFLTPGEHYVEFHSVDDLLDKILWLNANDEHRRRIAKQGQEFGLANYNSKTFWNLMLNALDRVNG